MGSKTAGPVDFAYSEGRALLEQLESDPRDALAGFMLKPGGGFIEWLCRYLQETLDVDLALVGEVSGRDNEDVNTLCIRSRDGDVENLSYQLRATDGFGILDRDHYECRAPASELFPVLEVKLGDELQSYFQTVIRDLDGLPLGVAAVCTRAPISEAKARSTATHLEVFRSRLAGELIRRRAIRSLQLASSSALTSQASLEHEKTNNILRQQLMDAEHRDSMGSLASGIAHDFNNILFAVSGQAHLVDRMYQGDDSLREQMAVIIAACDQASDLCQQLMVYAGNQPSSKTELDLNEVVRGCQRIAGIFAKGKTSIVYELANHPLLISGSLTRLQQLVMNLLKNASDAIDPGGSIRVTTRTEECSPRDFDSALLGENQKGGSYSVLEVSDNGPGIPTAMLRRIFTPSFSTKDTGHGMGLAAVMGSAKEHGAAIFVKTSPGGGSCFQIHFPAERAMASNAISDPVLPTPALRPGRPILVIDDDELVRRTVARILDSEGFHVTCAASGKEGLAAARRMAGSLSAIVLDYFMPQMLGDEVLVHLHELVPNVPVLLISGNVSSAQVDAFARPPRAFLTKPVLPQTLAATVRSMIQS